MTTLGLLMRSISVLARLLLALSIDVGLGCLVFSMGLAVVVVYRAFLHPLARVPGPRLAALSNIWHAREARHGRMYQLGKTLHRKYGPVVRVGPTEVWLDSKEAFRTIYRPGNGYEKSDFYLATALTRPRMSLYFSPHFSETLDLLSERSMSRYRLQRKLIGPVYQARNVGRYRSAVDAVVREAVQKLRALNGAEIDLKEWMHMIAVECLARVVLSWSPGLLKRGTDGGTSSHSYKGWRRKSVFGLFPTMVKVEILSRGAGRMFSNLWRVSFKPPSEFKTFFPAVQNRVARRMAALRHPNPKDDWHDLMADLICVHRKRPEFTEIFLKRMAMTNFGAGHETLASTLTSVLAMVGSHSLVQQAIQQEIRETPGHVEPGNFAYLQAAIKEANRLHPVVSMSLPRRVPSSGLCIHGYFLPPGTTVGCNPVALHRNPNICCGSSDPETYDPDRWLGSDPAAREMERCSLAWGGGARTCPGRHLAEMIINRVVAGLLGEFEVEVEMPPEEDMESYFLSMLTGVKAHFKARKASKKS